MNRATIATLALGAAMLFPNWAAAHVLGIDDVQPPQLTNDERERLTREFLPIVHDCPQIPATFHAQSMSEVVLERACAYLKEYEDNFHAQMQTDPRDSRPDSLGDYYSRVDILAFDRVTVEDRDNYTLQFYGYIIKGQRYVARHHVEGTNIQPRPRIFPGLFHSEGADNNPNLDPMFYFAALAHEYVHYLDDRYFGLLSTAPTAMTEGLASYLQNLPDDLYGCALAPAPRPACFVAPQGQNGYLYHRTVKRLIGDGSNLLTINDIHYEVSDRSIVYGWGSLLIRFLVEEHPQVLSNIKGIVRRPRSVERRSAYNDYVEEVFPTLEGDFHRWLREFVPLTAREIGPIVIPHDGPRIKINLVYHFYSSQDVTIDVSLPGSDVSYVHFDATTQLRTDVLIVEYYRYRMWLTPNRYGAPGTVEVTVTATTRDGESAEQTFTVTVVEALQSKAITLRDAVSTEEGETAINLASYFSGPALSDVEFTVASNKPDVARVAVRDGRLIITAVAAGEAEVTVRTDYYGRQTTQTFTVTITDDCPAYLCRGFFNGWRWLLLEDGQAAATETTETE